MPPKKAFKLRGGGKWPVGEPRVILRPLRADSSGNSRYRYTTHAPTSTLFNKPDLSDIRLKVGDQTFFAHRLILCAASDVFSRMLGADWLESNRSELNLKEEEECVKVFDRFLYFFYSGSIIISDSYVIPLYMLADKYNVTMLYDECVKVIENGLKVYVVTRNVRAGEGFGISGTQNDMFRGNGPSTSGRRRIAGREGGEGPYSSSSTFSDSSESDSTEGEADLPTRILRFSHNNVNAASSSSSHSIPNVSSSASGGGVYANTSSAAPSTSNNQVPSQASHSAGTPPQSVGSADTVTGRSPAKKTVKHLVASETFPLTLVMKMLAFCQNERISNAALYNLEARLCNQILHNNFGVWNDIPQALLVRILRDDFFYCNEYFLFCAAKSWLKYKAERQTEEILTDVLCCIRYPILSAEELYVVEKDDILTDCPDACKLVREAVRFNLFRSCSRARAEEDWTGDQFERRQVKEL